MMKTTLAALALAAAIVAPRVLPAQPQIGIPVGAAAPGAVVNTLDGKPVNLSQYIGKKPVMLVFWATWCTNCKHLEPQLLSLVKQYSPRVSFIDVAVSVNQSPERVRLYAQKYHYTQHVFYDTDGHAVDAYNVPATSYVVVIDKAGKVVYTGLGSDQNLRQALAKVL